MNYVQASGSVRSVCVHVYGDVGRICELSVHVCVGECVCMCVHV